LFVETGLDRPRYSQLISTRKDLQVVACIPNIIAATEQPQSVDTAKPRTRYQVLWDLGPPDTESAALATSNLHSPPPFDSSDSIAFYKDHRLSSKRSRSSGVTASHVLTFLFLLVALLVQFFSKRGPIALFSDLTSPGSIGDPFERGHCPHRSIFTEELPVSRPHKMTIVEEARKVAAEFEYPAEEVQKGVKEFIRQMGTSYPILNASALTKSIR
jgi:hypothetical protein